jgi:hypothetical protein
VSAAVDAGTLRPFAPALSLDAPPEQLRSQLAIDGYVLIRGAAPKDALSEVRSEFVTAARAAGWIEPGAPDDHPRANLDAACASPERAYLDVYHRLYHSERLHAVPHYHRLNVLMRALLDDNDVFAHPRLVARAVFPTSVSPTTPAHQDYFQVQGTEATLTAWMPLHDCSLELGSLAIARGSHTRGLLDVRPAPGASGAEVVDPLVGMWVGGDIEFGDVLVFTSLTVHKAAPNLTDRLRFSVDCRFQRVRDPVNRLSLEFTPQSDLTWDAIYRGWARRDHQYYWRNLPLVEREMDQCILRQRDEMSFAMGESGDARAVSALQRIAAYDPDATRRARAAALLDRLDAPL